MWGAVRLILSCVAILAASALLIDECIRLLECATHCGQRHRANVRLMQESVCGNWEHRRTLGDAAEQMCARAERENATPLVGCVARKYWAESGLANPYFALALVLPALLYYINRSFATNREAFGGTADTINHHQQQQFMRILSSLHYAPRLHPGFAPLPAVGGEGGGERIDPSPFEQLVSHHRSKRPRRPDIPDL